MGSEERDMPVDMQQQVDKLPEPLSCLIISPPGCWENAQITIGNQTIGAWQGLAK